MTTYDKLQKTLAALEGAKADLKQYSMDTKNQEAKQMFQQISNSLEMQCQQLRSRLQYVEDEEPQYTQKK